MEHDVVQVGGLNTSGFEAVPSRMERKTGVVFFARETLLFGCRHNNAVTQQARRGVVVEARKPEYVQLELPLQVVERTVGRSSLRPVAAAWASIQIQQPDAQQASG